MQELFGNLENLFNEILEEFGNENVENRLLAEFELLRVPKPKKVMWEVYNYDIEITEINSWTYNFVINARKIPEHLKTGTANCESDFSRDVEKSEGVGCRV